MAANVMRAIVRSSRTVVACILGSAGIAVPVLGQQRGAQAFDVSAARVTAPLATPGLQQSTDQMNEEGRMTASGFFLGVIGMLAGAAVGSGIGSATCDDSSNCVTRYASGGAAIVGALTVPVGVHVAADKPKRLPLTMLASVGVGGAIWGVMNAVPGRPVPLAPFIAAPLQIWVSTRLERSR